MLIIHTWTQDPERGDTFTFDQIGADGKITTLFGVTADEDYPGNSELILVRERTPLGGTLESIYCLTLKRAYAKNWEDYQGEIPPDVYAIEKFDIASKQFVSSQELSVDIAFINMTLPMSEPNHVAVLFESSSFEPSMLQIDCTSGDFTIKQMHSGIHLDDDTALSKNLYSDGPKGLVIETGEWAFGEDNYWGGQVAYINEADSIFAAHWSGEAGGETDIIKREFNGAETPLLADIKHTWGGNYPDVISSASGDKHALFYHSFTTDSYKMTLVDINSEGVTTYDVPTNWGDDWQYGFSRLSHDGQYLFNGDFIFNLHAGAAVEVDSIPNLMETEYQFFLSGETAPVTPDFWTSFSATIETI